MQCVSCANRRGSRWCAITLALGIGANTAIFTLIEAVMLKSLLVASPKQAAAILHYQRGPPLPR
ncbi:MAG: hypothetical protein DMG57_11285 [Acidobacteria bacterium]|nr:MAG: hypothetical protein DMG57_11285 [Acidobacteriota bacterium]